MNASQWSPLLIFIASLAFLQTGAWGAFLSPLNLPIPKVPPAMTESQFVRPNEVYPIDAFPIFQKAPPGVHISVGTERGFIGFTLNPNATHLLLLDADPFVHRYNRINIALLTLAKEGDLEDFKALRWEDQHSAILKRIQESKIKIPEFDELLSPENWNWWRKAASNREPALDQFPWDGYPLDSSPPSEDLRKPFAGTNYLWDQKQFKKLQLAAKQGTIESVQINLSDRSSVKKIVKELEKQNLKVSLFDLSNAWGSHYIKNADSLIRSFIPITKDPTIVLLTETEDIFNRSPTRLPGRGWNYFGYTFDEIKKNTRLFRPSLRAAIRKHNPDHSGKFWKPTTRTTLNGKPLLGSQPTCTLRDILKGLRSEK